MKHIIPVLATLLFISCAPAYMVVDSAEKFEIERYMGKWYEIYRLPNILEEELEDIVVRYELNDDGRILIINEGRLKSDNSRTKQAKGKAWIPDSKKPSRLKVSYTWPFSEDYWIFKIDSEYTNVLVGDPSGKHLWVLSRERRPEPAVISPFIEYASDLGFKIENFISGQVN